MFEKGNKLGSISTRKGVANKSTTEIRNKVQLVIDNNIDKLQSDLEKVEPKDRINFLIQLLSFTIPKLKAIEHTENRETNNFQTIIIETNEKIRD